MKITSVQNIKKYAVTVNQTTKQIRIVVDVSKKQNIVTIASLGKRGFSGENGKSAYQEWIDLGNIGSEQDFIDSLKSTDYPDLFLNVEFHGQTTFNVFSSAIKSNLYINDCIYFQDKSYHIQEVNNAWKLIWLNEFELSTNDFLIFRKLK